MQKNALERGKERKKFRRKTKKRKNERRILLSAAQLLDLPFRFCYNKKGL